MCSFNRVLWERLANLAHEAKMVREVLLAPSDILENGDSRETKEKQAPLGRLEPRDQRAPQ